jgi:hypothetical protein
MSELRSRSSSTSVALVTLGCARNDVDSEELAARLENEGFTLVAEPGDAEAVLVNTCGFVDQAKKDSIDTVLAATDLKDSGSWQSDVSLSAMEPSWPRRCLRPMRCSASTTTPTSLAGCARCWPARHTYLTCRRIGASCCR